MDIFVQIIGLVLIIICAVSFFFKKKEQFLICLIIYNLLVFLQYVLQQQLTESIITIIGVIREITFFVYEKKDKKPKLLILVLFEIMFVLIGVVTYQNLYSLPVIFSSMLSTFAQWQSNMFVLRVVYSVCSILVIINYAFTGLYTSIIAEAISLISSISSIFKYHILKSNIKTSAN